ncbi:hypothetical protein TWF730_007082 [Orbilia blumenaviensis]|uniref:Nephrocystin 3-like N-terminal domain-containing protein n=1 Tax=Orbilia blumenaviensis TaxID=1796055 RepID=A0AAV9VJK3_9PEZI
MDSMDIDTQLRQLKNEDYTIGWICALPLELAAAISILDEKHEPLPQDDSDDNIYEFGRVGHYNVIIACLPFGDYGVTSAAIVVSHMRHSYPSIVAGLMVGIAGGVPFPHDIRLGDVVVSVPVPGSEIGGVLQYDFGKTIQEGRFIQTAILNKPPKLFLAAVAKLRADNIRRGSQNDIEIIVADLLKNGVLAKEFMRPPSDSDKVFESSYDHPIGEGRSYSPHSSSCDSCDPSMVVQRAARSYLGPHIHYGLIASGNQVMKHGKTRDRLSQQKDILCFEMEAAGLMDELPTLVIRGICDYADSHKSKEWQPYAAVSAAVFAKIILGKLPARNNRRVPETVSKQQVKLNLPTADGAIFGSYLDQHKSKCLPGTRVKILKQILRWADDPDGRGIFWLTGGAGTGKSTISRTVAESLQQNGWLGASFFFQRDEIDRSSGVRFVTTIATQLAARIPAIFEDVRTAAHRTINIADKSLDEQFLKLIFEPLSRLSSSESLRLVVLIDALDECLEENDILIIINNMIKLKEIDSRSMHIDIRVFITSRPDCPIRPTFQALPPQEYEIVALHQVPDIESDIAAFIVSELSGIQKRRRTILPESWPDSFTINKLVKMTTPLFIYAATVCRFIGDEQWSPYDQINLLLDCNVDSALLQNTYLPILKKIISGQNLRQQKRLRKEFRLIVGTILSLFTPFSISSLSNLLAPELDKRRILVRLSSLHSVIDVPEDPDKAIQVFHASFRDFLLDSSDAGAGEFTIDEQKAHQTVANKCIGLMSLSLKQNICGVKPAGILRSEINKDLMKSCLLPEIQYACRYWIRHLRCGGCLIVDNDGIHDFLRIHALHWLELSSLMGTLLDTLRAIDSLMSIINVNLGGEVSSLLDHLSRFTRENYDIISQAPLQIYCSSLVFSPHSIIRQSFGPLETNKDWIKALPKTELEWGPCPKTIINSGKKVLASVISGHGALALALPGGVIEVWNTDSGELKRQLKGYEHDVMALTFSLDASILGSLSAQDVVELWNIVGGEPSPFFRSQTPTRPTAANPLEFSNHLGFRSKLDFDEANPSRIDEPILWERSGFLEGGLKREFAVSPDGGVVLLASILPGNANKADGSYDSTLTGYYPLSTELPFKIPIEHHPDVDEICFSPDAQNLAMVSGGNVIKVPLVVWDRLKYGAGRPDIICKP